MQIEDDTIGPAEHGIVGHDADVVHRAAVAGQGHPVVVIRGGSDVAGRDGDAVVLGDGEALDLDRALSRRRPPLTPETSEPRARLGRPRAESIGELLQLSEARSELRTDRRQAIDHG
jgi:hypothetical protein